MRVPVRNMAGQTVGELELRDEVFAAPVNEAVMHQALLRQRANARLGTVQTKTRSDVRGGGRKPWRQKGTGRARQGGSRAAQWRGGGIIFGPVPHGYGQKMNRKMRRLALRSALSTKVGEAQVIVMDELAFDSAKTKQMAEVLAEIQDGTFAREWILENQACRPVFNALKKADEQHQLEIVGKELRKMMPWLKQGKA